MSAAPPAAPGPDAPGSHVPGSHAPLPGERHVSEIAGLGGGSRPALGRKAGVGMIVAATALAVGFILLGSSKPDLRPEPGPEVAVRPVIRFEPPPAPPAPPAAILASLPAPIAVPPPPALPAAAPTTPAARATQPRLLVFSAGTGPGQAPAASPAATGPEDGAVRLAAEAGGSGLSQRLSAGGEPAGAAARVLANRPFLLTMGTVVPCVLQTAMDSTLPGLVACVIPQDVQGPTGLVLLDRGTRVVGQFQGDVRQGVERMFVLWTRAETPAGVVVPLASPATDPLGRAGVAGEVDRRFWQRFGGALVLSVVQGALQAGTAAVSREGSVSVNTGGTGAVLAEALRGSAALPPVVRKNQGELVSIFVARDLDFSGVYRLVPTGVAR